MPKSSRKSSKDPPSGADDGEEKTLVDTSDPSVDQAEGGSDPGDATAVVGGKNPSRSKKNAKKRRRGGEGDIDEDVNQGMQQTKRTRFKSPKPAKETANDSKMNDAEEKEANDEDCKESDAEDIDVEMEGKELNTRRIAANFPVGEGSEEEEEEDPEEENSNGKKNSAPKPTVRKKGNPPLQKLRVPSHQTPGKFAGNEEKAQSSDRPTKDLPVPSRRLVFNSKAVAAVNDSAASSTAAVMSQTHIIVNANGGSSSTVQVEPEQEQQEGRPQSQKLSMLAKPWVWFLIFLALHAAFYPQLKYHVLPKLAKASSALLIVYKNFASSIMSPPTKKVVNQTHVEVLRNAARTRREGKRQKVTDLQSLTKAMIEGVQKMETDYRELERDIKAVGERIKRQGEPIDKLFDKLSIIDNSLETTTWDDWDETTKPWQDTRNSFSNYDEANLLNLSSLDLWVIPEMPESCGGGLEDSSSSDLGEVEEITMFPAITHDRLEAWLKELEELVNQSTDEILASDEVSNEIRKWINEEIKKGVGWDNVLSKFAVEELREMIKKEKTKTQAQGGSQSIKMILSLIKERLELEIADQTGSFDYALIRNGASIIRKGPRATSHGLVQNMPFFNRLLAHVGLRFYGHGPEAALTQTDPQDALGQCWSFQSEEALAKARKKHRSALDFSRGTVATLAVRLAKPAYVNSVVLEHPPREITDRIESVIRAFRVIGYKDALAKEEAYELGRFEYKIDENNSRVEFPVARKTSRGDVPKLRSIALAIETTWGSSGDYGCLYRFRVHGDDNK